MRLGDLYLKNYAFNELKYCKENAKKYFIDMCGFEKNGGVGLEDACDVFERVFAVLEFKYVISFFGKDVFFKNTIKINNIQFSCEIFKNIPENEFLGIYFFVLTVGSLNISPSGILEEFYFDVSGTACVDAARDFIREKIIFAEKQKNCGNEIFVSDSLGPGFYGMKIEEVEKFFNILDCQSIGVSLSESGVIIPKKSCVGFFMVTKNKYFMKKDCQSCVGNKNGCIFCGYGRSL